MNKDNDILEESLRKVGTVWAPWRSAYVGGRRVPGKCVFCAKVAAEESLDRENLLLERGKKCFVCMNAFPYTPGHLLVLPYAHAERLDMLDNETRSELFSLVYKWHLLVEQCTGATGINLGLNMGKIAGAGIAEHLHMHIVPRYLGDTNFITTCADTRVVSKALLDLYDKYLTLNK